MSKTHPLVLPGGHKFVIGSVSGTVSIFASQIYTPGSMLQTVTSTVTLPTAAQLVSLHVANFGSIAPNDSYSFDIIPASTGATITIAALGTGVTAVCAGIVGAWPTGVGKRLNLLYKNVTAGQEAVEIYVLN